MNVELYNLHRVPLRVTNGIACFQRTIDIITKQHDLHGTKAYVDNIIVAGKTQLEHDENLAKLQEAVRFHLTLNETKSIICTITHSSLKPDPECLHPLKELPIPKDCTSLRHDIEALKAIDDLKEEIGEAVVHSIDETIPLVVEIDASDSHCYYSESGRLSNCLLSHPHIY
ncbi:uncharacterized protein LOC143021998 [Oratosquilla oratoria]|uniref:uncharacterized protein LOC143021998 n=1 Tax=Oratosquilla oratoria TaxID=337810 RepID=UPI003F7704BA